MLVAISQNYTMRREALRAKQMIEPRSPASGLAAQRESLAPSIVIIVALVFVGRGKPSPTRWLRRRHANGRNRVRRETGKEQMVRVHYDEGVAIHIGPESCAGGREAVREALTGECAGQPLSHEKVDIPGADAVRYAEGHTKGRAIASSPTTRRGRRPWHVQTLFVREPGGLVVDQGGMPRLVRIGKARSRSR